MLGLNPLRGSGQTKMRLVESLPFVSAHSHPLKRGGQPVKHNAAQFGIHKANEV